VRGSGFSERDIDGANEFAGGKVENRVSRAIIAKPNEHTTWCLGGEFVPEAVPEAEVGHAAKDLDVREFTRDAMEDGVRCTARPPVAASVMKWLRR
jgi:hypothetical protein